MLQNIKSSPGLSFFQKLLAEAFGTFILVYSAGVTQGDATSVAPALWAAMIATGFVSGAQFNPAVSIAVTINTALTRPRELSERLRLSIWYILVQLEFAYLGAYVAYLTINSNDKQLLYFDVSEGYKVGQAFVAEMFFTTVLAGCAVIGGHYTNSNILVGGLVATVVSAGDFAIGRYTGGVFNPAVGFGINMIYYTIKGNSTHRVWLYIIAPSVGGVLAGLITTFFIIFKKSTEELRKTYY